MHVGTIMTQNVIALQADDTLTTALGLMQTKRIRHLPIVSKRGEFLGLISHRDLLAASASFLSKDYAASHGSIFAATPVRKLMHRGVRTTTPDSDLREVARLMLENKWGCLPVLRGKVLAGIITASDFLALAINLLSLHEKLANSLEAMPKGGTSRR